MEDLIMSRHWYNNGVDDQVFREERPEGYIYDGMLESSKQKMREHEFTDEHRQNLSKARKGKEPYNKGMKMSDEVCKNISEGTKKAMNTPEVHTKLSKAKTGKKLSKEAKKSKREKEYETKKKNNSFKSSKPEEIFYSKLLDKYKGKTIYRHYKCDRYPFYCDFYIVEDDLFIELNAHWTHSSAPFDSNNEEHQKLLEEWQEKAKTSQFYANAIQTWTERDVEKLRVAKENNLNYKMVYWDEYKEYQE